ncbi:MAG: MBL fold metallo-hydrolase RNA specificity domain-containing protein, partial [Candidatus Odinarchaeia archaeon]
LSNHADYYQLLEYVKECAPKKVYTIHGYARELADTINKQLNIRALAITDIHQKTLTEFMM